MTFISAARTLIVASMALAFFGQVHALTVYDVIQLSSNDYNDQDIISLIDVTDSAFALQAEDVPRLMELGVSETVIQAMLKARLSETPLESVTGFGPAAAGHYDPVDDSARPMGATSVKAAPKPAFARKGFVAEPFEEEAAGGHGHRVITLSGAKLFVLRNEGSYSSVAARADAVADRLEEAASLGGGTFQPVHVAGSDTVMFSERDGPQSVFIVSVSQDDAYTYQRRSGRLVTPDLLADYWSALLSDYWVIATVDGSPARLAGIHEGEALLALYEKLLASGADTGWKLSGPLQSLPLQEQQHLLHLATQVPNEFGLHDSPDGEHQ